jgi:hypothetical protein
MLTSWTIAIDWDRNDSYEDAFDNVTDRVVMADWFLGMRQPYQHVADHSSLALVLKNHDQRFSPENAAGPLSGKLVPLRPVRIQSDDGETVRTHWVGWVESIQPTVGRFGERLTQIIATGAMQFLKASETRLELQENKRTDEVIAELIKEVVFPPAVANVWVLGRTGNSEVGQTTYLADTSTYSELEEGKLRLGMAGDNWVLQGGYSDVSQNTFDVYRAIADITAAERGRFFFNRDGQAIFWNRHHLLHGTDPAAAFDDDMNDMSYTFANLDQTKNEVIIVCHPRTISESEVTLWELGDAIIRVQPGTTREVFIKYEGESGQRVGGRDVTVSEIAFEKGTATVSVDARANGAELVFTNNSSKEAIVKKCVVKGRKIISSGEMEAKATDQESIVDHGRRTMRVSLPSIDDLEQAQYIADFERDRRSKPQGMVQTMTVLSHTARGGQHHEAQLSLTVGDMIAVKETQSAHEQEYYIIGEAHEMADAGNLFKTTWYLEPAPEEPLPCKLGVTGRSEVETSTVLTI